MNNLINPYDLGENIVAENLYKVSVNELLTQAKRELKLQLLKSQIEMLGIQIELTSSKTRFEGERLWFLCPSCKKRVGTLYKHPVTNILGCRTCLRLKYKAQRYKGMTEIKT